MSTKIDFEQARNARWWDVLDVEGKWLGTSQGTTALEGVKTFLSSLSNPEEVEPRIGAIAEAEGFGAAFFGAGSPNTGYPPPEEK